MRRAGAVFQGCSLVPLWRKYVFKAVIVGFALWVLLLYGTDIFVYKQPINRVVSPGLTWISNSFNVKFSTREAKDTKVLNSSHLNSIKIVSPPTNISVSKTVVNTTKFAVANKTNFGVSQKLLNASHGEFKSICPVVPPKLVGRLKVLEEAPSFEELEKMFSNLDPGGRYKPTECIARFKVALIIPYRDREEHLRIFLHNLHPMLQRQQLDYGIYVIEEAADTKFNRAMLMNIGYAEALKQYDYDCFIFHDVDLIPEDDRNIYSCPEQPRHMSVAINVMNYRLPYKDIFGGVSALTKKHMEILNGFSNEFWGWGGEDDDMSNRIRHHGLKISRYPPKVARYTMLKHKKDEPNPERYNKLYKGKYRFKKDGLSNLKYKREDIILKKLYTWVLVEVEPIKK